MKQLHFSNQTGGVDNAPTLPAAASAALGAKAALAFVFTVILLDLTGMTLLIPVQAYIVRQYNTDALTVSLLSAIYAAAQFVAAPILGKLSDRYGRRPLLLVSVFGSAVGYMLFGVGGALWVLFLSRLIDGLTGGNISIASAYIADITPPAQRAKNFALVGAAFGVGFILGPALGGALGQISLAAPAYAAGALSLLSAGFGYFVLPETLPKAMRTAAAFRWHEVNPVAPIVELLRRPGMRSLLIAQSLFNFVMIGFNSVCVIYLIEKFQIVPVNVGALLVVIGIANVVVQALLVGPLVRLFGEKPLAIAGPLFQAIANLSIMIVPAYWMLYPVMALTSGAAGPFRPATTALLANQVTPEEQGKLNGVITGLSSLMGIFGVLWAGAAYDAIAPIAPFCGGRLPAGRCQSHAVRVKSPAWSDPYPARGPSNAAVER